MYVYKQNVSVRQYRTVSCKRLMNHSNAIECKPLNIGVKILRGYLTSTQLGLSYWGEASSIKSRVKTWFTLYFTRQFQSEEDWGKWSWLNRAGKNFKKCISWKWATHAKLYSDLSQAKMKEDTMALDSQNRGAYFLHLQYRREGQRAVSAYSGRADPLLIANVPYWGDPETTTAWPTPVARYYLDGKWNLAFCDSTVDT